MSAMLNYQRVSDSRVMKKRDSIPQYKVFETKSVKPGFWSEQKFREILKRLALDFRKGPRMIRR